MERVFNLVKDKEDNRDFLYKAMLRTAAPNIKEEVDLEPLMSPVFDQGSLGSCGASAGVKGLREFFYGRDGASFVEHSVLFTYWYARYYDNNSLQDSGTRLREVMRSMCEYGCAPEIDFPYVESTFTERPTLKALADAKPCRIREYHRVSDLNALLQALSDGVPVVVGIPVFPCLTESATALTGVMRMPVPGEASRGGHGITAMGYKSFPDGQRYIKCKQSWGTGWGQNGYFWMPENFILFYVMDMWTGSTTVTELGVTYTDAVNLYSDLGIFDSLALWLELGDKYANDTTSDFRYFQLAYRKIAAYMINHDYVATYVDAPLLSYADAVDLLFQRGIFDSPDFWLALGTKYANVSSGDFQYVSLAICKLATYIVQQA